MNELGYTPRGARRARSDAMAPSARAASRGIQIGPRIRVGGTIGHIGQQLKLGVGKLAHNPLVDAALSFVPGIGPLAAAAIAATGRAMDTSDGGVGLGDIVKSGAEGFGAAKLGGAVKTGLGMASAAGAANGGGLLNTAKSLVTGGGSDGQGSMGVVGDLAGKAPGMVDKAMQRPASGGPSTLDKLLMAASIADSAATSQHNRGLDNEALGLVRGLPNVKGDTPDFTGKSGNPYQKSGYMVGGGRQLGSAVPVSTQKSGYLVGAA
jgi:hypothetical protein